MPNMYKPKRGFQRKRSDLTGRPHGRPTLYKPEYCDIVAMTLGFGGTHRECMDYLKIDEQTYYNWQKKHPAFLEACDKGKQILHYAVKASVLKKVRGFHEYDEKEIIDEKGKTKKVRYKRYYEPDSSLLINHVNKTAPIYKDAQDNQVKSLMLVEFEKLRQEGVQDQPSEAPKAEDSLEDIESV